MKKVKINYRQLPRLFEVKTGKVTFGDGIFSTGAVTLKGFDNHFVVNEYRQFRNEIGLPTYDFKWDKKLVATLIPVSQYDNFERFFFERHGIDGYYFVTWYADQKGIDIHSYSPREEVCYTDESSDGYRKGRSFKKMLSSYQVFQLENPKLHREIQTELDKERKEFKEKHFKRVTILDLSEYNLEFYEMSKYDKKYKPDLTEEQVDALLAQIKEGFENV